MNYCSFRIETATSKDTSHNVTKFQHEYTNKKEHNKFGAFLKYIQDMI